MVIPEREVPGIRASACAQPTMSAVHQRHLVEQPLLAADAVGDEEEDAVEEGGAGDQQRVAGVGLDPVLGEQPGDAGGDGADHDRPGHGPGDELAVARPRRAGEEAGDQVAHVAVEVGEDGDQRPRVGRDVEAEPLVGPVEEVGDQDQVARGADGQELGEPLDDAEDDGLERTQGFASCWTSKRAATDASRGFYAQDARSRAAVSVLTARYTPPASDASRGLKGNTPWKPSSSPAAPVSSAATSCGSPSRAAASASSCSTS